MTFAGSKAAVKFAAAIGVAVVGLALAWRALGPMAAVGSRPAGAAATNGIDLAPRHALALPDSLPVNVTSDTAPATAARLRAHFRDQFAAPTEPRPIDEESLLNEIEDLYRIYLSGSFEEYMERLRRTGARSPLLTDENAELNAQIEFIWKNNVATIAENPISIDDAVVRARFIDGRDLAPPDLGTATVISAPDRHSLPADPTRARLTVYEFLLPVLYEHENRRGPVWWGVWLARAFDQNAWVQYRSVIYDPVGVNAPVIPIY